MTDAWGIYRKIAFRWTSMALSNDVKHWFSYWFGVFRQRAITWSNVGPPLCRHMASLGQSVSLEFAWFDFFIQYQGWDQYITGVGVDILELTRPCSIQIGGLCLYIISTPCLTISEGWQDEPQIFFPSGHSPETTTNTHVSSYFR